MPDKKIHIHLIGICGTAMASLAGMLKTRGFEVTGSDAAAYPPMSDFLAGLGIRVAQPYSEKSLSPRPDLVVVGNAISRGNPELEYILDEGIPGGRSQKSCESIFLRDATRWWSPARTARPRLLPCWRGSSSMPGCIPRSWWAASRKILAA